jgi:hypothetical protein
MTLTERERDSKVMIQEFYSRLTAVRNAETNKKSSSAGCRLKINSRSFQLDSEESRI